MNCKLRCLLAMCLLTICAASTVAEVPSGATLTGTVSDPKGAVLPNASVVLHNEDLSVTAKTTSDNAGHFTLTGLKPGTMK
jgi:protocatechuate 3,4-dioxygenase beta subunit